MILNGNQRGGAKDLALHLMKDENEHVELHEIRGFAPANLMGALNEAYAVSRGTKCKQYLYSLSLNPPQTEKVGTADFEAAIEKVEKKLGLSGQPRVIVFHEKQGRRHAHAVWSRIDADEMKAVQLSFDHQKLKAISRELFIEHGWKMPEGLANSELRDPKNFSLAEWQQAKRINKDPRAIKTAFQDSWAISDSKAAFVHAMDERGYKVARGDRRGFVAVDVYGEVYSIPRQANVKTKGIRARLGDENDLPSVAEVKEQISEVMLSKLDGFQRKLEEQDKKHRSEFERLRKTLVERQRNERQTLSQKIEIRRVEENEWRQARFRTGIGGIWDRVRGEHRRIQAHNERDAYEGLLRERSRKDALVFHHLEERKQISLVQTRDRSAYQKQIQGLELGSQFYQHFATLRRQVMKDAKPVKQFRPRIRGPSRDR